LLLADRPPFNIMSTGLLYFTAKKYSPALFVKLIVSLTINIHWCNFLKQIKLDCISTCKASCESLNIEYFFYKNDSMKLNLWLEKFSYLTACTITHHTFKMVWFDEPIRYHWHNYYVSCRQPVQHFKFLFELKILIRSMQNTALWIQLS
jgi:hypothetical protein